MNEPRFDVFMANHERHISRLFSDVPLAAAEILSGSDREVFYAAIINRGWSGTSPAWTSFQPVVIVPHGQLLKLDQFTYLIELVG